MILSRVREQLEEVRGRMARAFIGVVRQADRLSEETLRGMLQDLGEYRDQAIEALRSATAGGVAFDVFAAEQVIGAVDFATEELRGKLEQRVTSATAASWTLGGSSVDKALIAGGIEAGIALLPVETLLTLQAFSLDLVDDLVDDVRRRVRRTVRQGAIGLLTPTEVIEQLRGIVPARRDLRGRLRSASARAEAIARTELGRIFSSANQSRFMQASERIPGLRKWWLTRGDDRVRPSHRTAGERFGQDNPIPVDQPFDVGGSKLMFPRDPGAPAREVVNCRCVHVPVVPEPEAA